jgi:AcrR family transcriptional regulator
MSTHAPAPTRREQILRQAARLFAERGFHGVGVDEIGAAVGISGPGLYRHFSGKDAMLAELLVGISGRLLAGGKRRAAEAAEAGRTPAAVLDSLIEGHIDFAFDDRPLITLHDRELDRLRDSDRKLVRSLQRQYVELWVEVVRQVHPGLAEAESRACVHAVFGLLNSTPHLSRRSALPDRAAMADLLRRLALGALAAAPATSGSATSESTGPESTGPEPAGSEPAGSEPARSEPAGSGQAGPRRAGSEPVRPAPGSGSCQSGSGRSGLPAASEVPAVQAPVAEAAAVEAAAPQAVGSRATASDPPGQAR